MREGITLIGDGHVPDEVWDRARANFDEYELAQNVFAIATINVWNRLTITARYAGRGAEPRRSRGLVVGRVPRPDRSNAALQEPDLGGVVGSVDRGLVGGRGLVWLAEAS